MESVDMMLEPVRALSAAGRRTSCRACCSRCWCSSAGWLVAKAARFAIEKALRAINFHVLTERAGIDGFLRQGGMQTDTSVDLRLAGVLAGDPRGADRRVQQPRA